MVTLRLTALAMAAASLATLVQADYYIDPESVPKSTRQNWCDSEERTCPFICQQTGDGSTKVNECDAETLTYGCICGDGKQPNVSEYSLTLPYFVCQEWGNQCVEGCKGDNKCASACREDNPCGATNPKRANATKTASKTAKETASETDDATKIYDDLDGGENSKSDKTGAGAALEVGRTWGLPVVLGSMFVGFAML